MLANGEDKGVVCAETRALWLHDVEVVPLGMWGWVPCEEGVRWVWTRMGQWQSQRESVRVGFYGVL
jgi:hypothetical protein